MMHIDIAATVYLGVTHRLYEFSLRFNGHILNFYVPALCVTHVMILWRLARK